MNRQLELLAPAKDAPHGMTAIDYGADAVYIGGPRFGARNAAGNSMADIERLAQYAHRFRAKVFLAINTVLYDDELAGAEKIARQAWNAGVDALIVQDMAFTQMDLPPIPLHASTQTFNMSPEKARFFEQAGFSRVILERALGLDEIKAIRAATDAELEAFVHGAICVCYSGQCYMSQAISGRSGNRGECMQPCRWDYNLTGEGFSKLAQSKHLLSVNDLNLSGNLEELIDAGVNSFKIEGRLKDVTYLKNSVAFYRKKLDEIIDRRPDLSRSSEGRTAFDFVPDPEKSFSRGFTDYFLKNSKNKVSSFDTPKSVGQYVGEVKKVTKDSFLLDQGGVLANGDGICFVSGGEMQGTNVNKAEGKTVWPNRMEGIVSGLKIYRNYDHAFARNLDRSRTRRSVGIKAEIDLLPESLTLRFSDPGGNTIEKVVSGSFVPAMNAEKAEQTIRQQVTKTGDTIFQVEDARIAWDQPRFVPASVLNPLRREALTELDALRIKTYRRDERKTDDSTSVLHPEKALDYRSNVTNRLACEFYEKHGVTDVEDGFELQTDHIGKEVMRTKYCIRRETGQCLKEKSCTYRGPMQLENNFHIFGLHFDCSKCEMALIYKGKRK